MGTALTGSTVASTYDALLKVTDNGPLGATAKVITDGMGNDSALKLGTAGAEITGPLTLSGASAGQIVFPASQNASAGANTLDDYEEGTWTPAVGGDATYTTQTGRYTKIGRVVHLFGRLTIDVLGTGSAHTVSGLPVAAESVGGFPVTVSYWADLAVAPVFVGGYVSGSTIVFGGLTAAGADLTDSLGILGDAADVMFSATYNV